MEYHCSNSACKDRELRLPEEYAEKLGRVNNPRGVATDARIQGRLFRGYRFLEMTVVDQGHGRFSSVS